MSNVKQMQKSFLFDIANIFVDNLYSAKTSAFIVIVSAVFAAVVVGSVAVVVVVVDTVAIEPLWKSLGMKN